MGSGISATLRYALVSALACAAWPAMAQEANSPQPKSSLERLIESYEHFDPNLAPKAAQKNVFDLLRKPGRCLLRRSATDQQACAVVVFTPLDSNETDAPRYYYMPVMELPSSRKAHVLFNGKYQDLSFEQMVSSIEVTVGAGRRIDYIPLAVIGNREDDARQKSCGTGTPCNALAPCSHDQLFDHSGGRVNSCWPQ